MVVGVFQSNSSIQGQSSKTWHTNIRLYGTRKADQKLALLYRYPQACSTELTVNWFQNKYTLLINNLEVLVSIYGGGLDIGKHRADSIDAFLDQAADAVVTSWKRTLLSNPAKSSSSMHALIPGVCSARIKIPQTALKH